MCDREDRFLCITSLICFFSPIILFTIVYLHTVVGIWQEIIFFILIKLWVSEKKLALRNSPIVVFFQKHSMWCCIDIVRLNLILPCWSGLNFINVLRTAFTLTEPKTKRKKDSQVISLFMHSGSTSIKAEHKYVGEIDTWYLRSVFERWWWPGWRKRKK